MSCGIAELSCKLGVTNRRRSVPECTALSRRDAASWINEKKLRDVNLQDELVFAGHDPRLNVTQLIAELSGVHGVVPPASQLTVQLHHTSLTVQLTVRSR